MMIMFQAVVPVMVRKIIWIKNLKIFVTFVVLDGSTNLNTNESLTYTFENASNIPGYSNNDHEISETNGKNIIIGFAFRLLLFNARNVLEKPIFCNYWNQYQIFLFLKYRGI